MISVYDMIRNYRYGEYVRSRFPQIIKSLREAMMDVGTDFNNLSPLELQYTISLYTRERCINRNLDTPYNYVDGFEEQKLKIINFGYSIEDLKEQFPYVKQIIDKTLDEMLEEVRAEFEKNDEELEDEDIADKEVELFEALASSEAELVVEFFKFLLVKRIITGDSPNFKEVERSIYFSNSISTLVTSEYGERLFFTRKDEEEKAGVRKNRNFLENYKFIEKNFLLFDSPHFMTRTFVEYNAEGQRTTTDNVEGIEIYDRMRNGSAEDKAIAENFLEDAILKSCAKAVGERALRERALRENDTATNSNSASSPSQELTSIDSPSCTQDKDMQLGN